MKFTGEVEVLLDQFDADDKEKAYELIRESMTNALSAATLSGKILEIYVWEWEEIDG